MKFFFHVEPNPQDATDLHVAIVSKRFWGINKNLSEDYTVAEGKALNPILAKVRLKQIADCVFDAIGVDRTIDQVKAELIAEGLEENQEFSDFVVKGENPATPILAPSHSVTSGDLQIEFVGDDKTIQLDMLSILPIVKKTWPEAGLFSVNNDTFARKCESWDDTCYLFQDEARLITFLNQMKQTLTNEKKKLDIDIHVSEDGDVVFDRIGAQEKIKAKQLQSVAQANKELAKIVQTQTKTDRKFNVEVEIVATNEYNHVKRFKMRGTYTDSQGRGKIDIDLNNDLNQDDIKALLDYKNEEGSNFNDFELEGPAYSVKPDWFQTYSIGKFCIDQLHAGALQVMIDQFQELKDQIKKPIRITA